MCVCVCVNYLQYVCRSNRSTILLRTNSMMCFFDDINHFNEMLLTLGIILECCICYRYFSVGFSSFLSKCVHVEMKTFGSDEFLKTPFSNRTIGLAQHSWTFGKRFCLDFRQEILSGVPYKCPCVCVCGPCSLDNRWNVLMCDKTHQVIWVCEIDHLHHQKVHTLTDMS